MTQKETREKVEKFVEDFFAEEFNSLTNGEDVLQMLNEMQERQGTKDIMGTDWKLDFDHWGNVADWVDGEVVVTYYSESIKRSIVINSMFTTDGYKTPHELADMLILTNDEALRQEQELSILKNA